VRSNRSQRREMLGVITSQMEALSKELERVGNDRARRKEIIDEIIRLGKIFRSIRDEAESSSK
jgi:hypothetical protein